MKVHLSTLLVGLLIFSGCKPGEQPSGNHDHLLYATLWFQQSPEAKALCHQAFNIAKLRAVEYSGQPGNKPKAVVVDIDETLLDNSPFEAQQIIDNEEFTSEFWFEWTKLGRAAALPGSVDFTQFCDSLGIEVFYVSNRKLNEVQPTLRNLDSLGFAFADANHMYFKDKERGKQSRRNQIAQKFEIVMLVGDNLNDFATIFENRGDDWGAALVEQFRNEFGKRFIILPNPMYGEWEDCMYRDHGMNLTQKRQVQIHTLLGFR